MSNYVDIRCKQCNVKAGLPDWNRRWREACTLVASAVALGAWIRKLDELRSASAWGDCWVDLNLSIDGSSSTGVLAWSGSMWSLQLLQLLAFSQTYPIYVDHIHDEFMNHLVIQAGMADPRVGVGCSIPRRPPYHRDDQSFTRRRAPRSRRANSHPRSMDV